MKDLKRILVDKFSIDMAIDFETLENEKNNIDKRLITMEEVFDKFPKLKLTDRKKELFLNGVMLTFELEDGVYNIYSSKNEYIGTGTVKNNLLKRDIVI